MKQNVTKAMWDELIEKLGEDFVNAYCQKYDSFATNVADEFPTPLEHYKDEMRKKHEQRR